MSEIFTFPSSYGYRSSKPQFSILLIKFWGNWLFKKCNILILNFPKKLTELNKWSAHLIKFYILNSERKIFFSQNIKLYLSFWITKKSFSFSTGKYWWEKLADSGFYPMSRSCDNHLAHQIQQPIPNLRIWLVKSHKSS